MNDGYYPATDYTPPPLSLFRHHLGPDDRVIGPDNVVRAWDDTTGWVETGQVYDPVRGHHIFSPEMS